jgi:predicted ATPase
MLFRLDNCCKGTADEVVWPHSILILNHEAINKLAYRAYLE